MLGQAHRTVKDATADGDEPVLSMAMPGQEVHRDIAFLAGDAARRTVSSGHRRGDLNLRDLRQYNPVS